jgi:hypothetical protein
MITSATDAVAPAIWIAVLFLLGLIAIAAVLQLRVNCRENDVVLTSDDGRPLTNDAQTKALTADERARSCRLAINGL